MREVHLSISLHGLIGINDPARCKTNCFNGVKKCVVIAANPKHMVSVIIRTAYAYSRSHVTRRSRSSDLDVLEHN